MDVNTTQVASHRSITKETQIDSGCEDGSPDHPMNLTSVDSGLSFSDLLFEQFPLDLTSSIICAWLPLKSVVRLDSACLGTTTMTTFSMSIKHRHLHPTTSSQPMKAIHQLVDWTLSREVFYSCDSIRTRNFKLVDKDFSEGFPLITSMLFKDNSKFLHLATMFLEAISRAKYRG